MRLRSAVLASLLTALVATVVPSVVNAAPRHNRGLTINAVPHHILSGEGVIIYGQLKGPDNARKRIVLYHHIATRPGYSRIGTTTTDSRGFYEFTRAEGVVLTDRSWFTRGPDGTHSRTVYERVDALVSLATATTSADTLHRVVLAGAIAPAHPFQRVLIEQRFSGDDWRVLASGFTRGDSSFRIVHRFRFAGLRELRAVFLGDRRNARSFSDPISLLVEQAQIAGFTVNSSAPLFDYPGSATISGVLDHAGTTTAESGEPVTLFARTATQPTWQSVASTTTGNDGSYSFAVSPTDSTYYQVRVTMTPTRHTAVLFEGVRSAVTATPGATTAPTGTTVTFTGTVLPASGAGVPVYLQRLGKDADWHTVAVAFTNGGSGYSVSWTLGDPGTDTFRTKVLADRLNLAGASPKVTITVTPASSPLQLAPAS